MKRWIALLTLAVIAVGTARAADQALPLRVLYVGNARDPRATDHRDFLQKHFKQVRIANRVDFDPATAKDADVVLLDWAQGETDVRQAKSPFGKLEDWSKPTVLLGSAGLLMAGPWRVAGGAG